MGAEVVEPWIEQLQSESEYRDIICKLYWIENDKLWMTNADGRVQAVVPQAYRRCSAYAVPDKSAKTIARVFVEELVAKEASCPKVLISDRGREFENEVFKEIVDFLQHNLTVGHNPRQNGLTERMNKTLVAMLARSTQNPSEWDARLPFVLYAYNTAPHDTTGESPYFLLHGTDPILPFRPEAEDNIRELVIDIDHYRAELLRGLQKIRAQASRNLRKAQALAKEYYDKRNRTVAGAFKVGERVLVYMPTKKGKLYAGPYRIIELSENSALVRLIGKTEQPFRVQIDHLKKSTAPLHRHVQRLYRLASPPLAFCCTACAVPQFIVLRVVLFAILTCHLI
ncbi:unnamed protein product [Gongylonema pulchrum]|uniref:Integrase catalytic domain-containing protein n=1 Tax=Gongylonema pulchrum TaxID=637853 RepID=A0A183E5E6_9BILA|nr:unnamed protein product [Gongylonema pulchrum]